MKNYLSFGGGVNSVAMYLMLMDQGMTPGDPDKGFEAVFVDHGTDWPETYEYVDMFIDKGNPITIIKPRVGTVEGRIFDNLYEYYRFKRVFPFRRNGACTGRFKVETLQRYQESPAFVLIGYAIDESHRAKLKTEKGFEYRYPLIESEINRQGCKDIIKKYGLPEPRKSGCFVCPYQSVAEYKELRSVHPDLFCKAEQLENGYIKRREKEGKDPIYMLKNATIKILINENQSRLWKEDEYPPCECML